jgi:hypothetical protein
MRNLYKTLGLILITFSILVPSVIFAQAKIEITPFGGYMFGGKLRFYEGELKVENSGNYGILLDVAVARDTKLEFFWSQMSTTAKFKPYYGFDFPELTDAFKVNINYIQIGGVQEANVNNDKVKPFGAFTLGATYFNPTDNNITDNWQFSVTLGGGAKFWFTDRIGIRLQGRLLMPLYFAGAGVYFGTGGSGLSVGAGSTILQGDLTAGLIIGLGDF